VKSTTRAYSIDTNVIVRYLVQDDPRLTPKAVAIMEAIQDGRLAATCDPVILGEAVWVLSSVYGLVPERIAEGLIPIIQAPQIDIPNRERYVRALNLYATGVPHFGDACLCATAMERCEGRVLSFDRKLSGVEGITRAESVPA
jgi:predicted nucleic-acid-binding protein